MTLQEEAVLSDQVICQQLMRFVLLQVFVWGASEGAGHMSGQGARLVPGMPAPNTIIILATAVPNWTELLFLGTGKDVSNTSVSELVIAITDIECCTSCAVLPSTLPADIGFLARCTSPLCVCTSPGQSPLCLVLEM